MNISGLRKRAAFNVAQYDVLYGKETVKPHAMDFLSPQGFVPGSKFKFVLICIHACMHMAIHFPEAGPLHVFDAITWMHLLAWA